MLNKQVILLCLGFSLIGCSKHHGLGLTPATAPYKDRTIVVMGQSNGFRFVDEGGAQAFAQDIQSFAPGQVRVINCAVPGSAISTWMPGNVNYQACIDLIGQNTIDAVLWDQGEAEAESSDATLVDSWTMNFTSLITSFRTVIKGGHAAPVLYCRLGDLAFKLQPGFWNKMRGSQEDVHIANAVMVNLDGIAFMDNLHYDANGYAQIAKRYADAYKEALGL